MNREDVLLRRIRGFTWLFIIGLLISGVTAIPLQWEIDLIIRWMGISQLQPADAASGLAQWLLKVREGLHATDARYPFVFYGMDWLAFGHIVIAIAFVGALRDPLRNKWLFEFGMIACALVVPWAFAFGHLRGIPMGWRLIDCSFGIFGILPLWICHKWTKELGDLRK